MKKPDKIIEHPARDPVTGKILTYTPGYVPHKIGMFLVSLLVLALGCGQLLPSVYLLCFGQRASAEVTRIIKVQEGHPEAILMRDADWKASTDQHNRSVVFWNDYQFKTADGNSVTFRGRVGQVFRPPQPLLDEDGLPTTVPVYYDPQKPQRVLLPLELSTWFFSGIVSLFGLVGSVVSLVVLYYARKPIPLPIIVDAS